MRLYNTSWPYVTAYKMDESLINPTSTTTSPNNTETRTDTQRTKSFDKNIQDDQFKSVNNNNSDVNYLHVGPAASSEPDDVLNVNLPEANKLDGKVAELNQPSSSTQESPTTHTATSSTSAASTESSSVGNMKIPTDETNLLNVSEAGASSEPKQQPSETVSLKVSIKLTSSNSSSVEIDEPEVIPDEPENIPPSPKVVQSKLTDDDEDSGDDFGDALIVDDTVDDDRKPPENGAAFSQQKTSDNAGWFFFFVSMRPFDM